MDRNYLGEICTIQYGFPFDSSKFSTLNGTPLIRIRDVVRGYTETFTTEKCKDEYVVREGDLLIGMDGDFNIAKWGKTPAYLNQRVCRLIPKEVVDKNYLYYFMPNELKKIEDKTSFVTVKHLSAKELNKIEIALPPLAEQQKISTELDKICELIAKRKSQIEKLDLLVKAKFVEMFGQPGDDVKGWGLKQLSDCCILNPRKNSDKPLSSDILVSFLPMSAVSENGTVNLSDVKTYDEVKNGFTYFAENDVLFAKITPCMENGKGAIAKGLKNGIGFGSTEFHVLRPIMSQCNPYWLYALTAFHRFRKDAAANMTGSAGQRRVPISFLNAYNISLPPLPLQIQFADFVQKTEQIKITMQKSLAGLETLYKARMQEYFE